MEIISLQKKKKKKRKLYDNFQTHFRLVPNIRKQDDFIEFFFFFWLNNGSF